MKHYVIEFVGNSNGARLDSLINLYVEKNKGHKIKNIFYSTLQLTDSVLIDPENPHIKLGSVNSSALVLFEAPDNTIVEQLYEENDLGDFCGG